MVEAQIPIEKATNSHKKLHDSTFVTFNASLIQSNFECELLQNKAFSSNRQVFYLNYNIFLCTSSSDFLTVILVADEIFILSSKSYNPWLYNNCH